MGQVQFWASIVTGLAPAFWVHPGHLISWSRSTTSLLRSLPSYLCVSLSMCLCVCLSSYVLVDYHLLTPKLISGIHRIPIMSSWPILLKFNGYLCNFYFGPVQALWNKLHLQSSSSRRACQLWAWSEELQWLLIYTRDLDAKQLCVTKPPSTLCLSHPLHFILWHLSAYIWFYYLRELVSWTDESHLTVSDPHKKKPTMHPTLKRWR